MGMMVAKHAATILKFHITYKPTYLTLCSFLDTYIYATLLKIIRCERILPIYSPVLKLHTQNIVFRSAADSRSFVDYSVRFVCLFLRNENIMRSDYP